MLKSKTIESLSPLFSPSYIGNMKIKNRVIMAPMETNMPSITGEVNERVLAYYRERAEGGAGAIIVEFTCVDAPVGKGTDAQLLIDHNKFIPGHTYLTEEIQKNNCRAILQLHHSGRQTNKSITNGLQPVAPSPIACNVMKSIPKELTAEEIDAIVMKFIKGAYRAQKAGYDGVELHAAHGYLLGSFLSPYTNRRDDKYGGDVERRSFILKKIIEGIKVKNGQGFPIIVRFSADEFVENGMHLEEAIKVAQLLEGYGADALHISTGIFETNDKNIDPMSASQGWRIPYAEAIKKSIGIPIIGVGVIREPCYANEIIEKNQADFIALGRALLADPDWVQKAKLGKVEEINRCTTCGYCTDRLTHHQSIRCAVNPRAGRELNAGKLLETGTLDKKVHVVGGGSTGMHAAMLAGQRGFEVVLYERNSELGGLLTTAGAAPGKGNWKWFKDYLITMLSKMGNVSVVLNHEMTTEKLHAMQDDYIIDATGMVPKIDGKLRGLRIPVLQVEEAMLHRGFIDKNIAILGARGAGLEAAHLFASQNNRVAVVARSGKDANGRNIDRINRMDLLCHLKQEDVIIYNNCDIAVDENGNIGFLDLDSQQPVDIKMDPDLIVSARGFDASNELDMPNLIKVGGSQKPGKILEGVWQSYVAVSQLK